MKKSSFQEIILKLQDFWASHGCLITQPYYTQVGAGTMNPNTFLRVLGPEPWNVAYVEPSVRPDDGRYGENPNRFQLHTQYQVILKPDPGNPQELYLESLKALGIDPRQHDIRFVEDNWEQPAISAWGLGWEVWLDGQEITQFTYFQQMGGVALDPVSVEITYGLERILIALNNAKAIWDEEWGAGVSYGEIRHQEEFEHSKYYFETADVERVRAMYDLFSAEADACLAQGLIVPAHDYVLKCSHCFNILDTRGAISVAERQAFFRRIRELAKGVAVAYGEQRKSLEYPLLKETEDKGPKTKSASNVSSSVLSPSSFLLEIGVEEIPADDVDTAYEQLGQRIPTLLKELYLDHGNIRIFSTPRRIVLSIDSLSPNQPDRDEVVKGPPADKAFDKDGIASPAAMGFAKKNGVDTKALEVREQDGGKYVFAVVKQKGRPTPEVLMEALPKVVESIKFEKSMKWLPASRRAGNESGVAFSRPIRWYVTLLGDVVIPFEYAGVVSSNTSRGLRPYGSPDITIPSAEKYFDKIREAGILLDKEERKASIIEQVKQAAALVGGEAIIEEGLLNEVANLIEMPTAVMGGFNEEFLSLPRDVLISVMKKHQRYFPVQKNGKLLAHFVAIRNGDDIGIDTVREGNEHVLGARFADANFFVREDVKLKLEEYRPKLSSLTFHTKLGSMLDKSQRIEKLVNELIPMLKLEKDEAVFARRAAHLSKADLVTQMVTEMTSLQGIIGGEYALRSGEQKDVAAAIGEQYQTVPQSKAGLAVALADRLDSLVGLFAAGFASTGAKDPFGLRRAAIGIVQPLIEHNISFDLRAAIKKAGELQPNAVKDVVQEAAGPIRVDHGHYVLSNEIQNQVLEFIAGRLKVVLSDLGYKYDIVDAILAVQSNNPAGTVKAVKQLQAWVAREDWPVTLDGFARCVRITRDQKEIFKVNEKLFADKEEKDLFKAVQANTKVQPFTVDEFLNIILKLVPSINTFFDKVLVMTEDKAVKENRLGLLQRIADLAKVIADLSKLEGFNQTRMPFMRLIVLLSLLVFLGVACTQGGPVRKTPVPTLEIPSRPQAEAQTETSISTAVTDNAQVLEGPNVNYNGIRFTLDPAIGSSVYVFDDVTSIDGLTAHNTRFALTAEEYCQTWCLMVYPVAEFEQAFGSFVFPPAGYRGGAAVIFKAQDMALSFQNGSGDRGLEAFGQNHYGVSNESLKYVFRGYSADKQYGVFVQLPIHAASLPDAAPTLTADAQDILEYNQQAAESMNALGPGDFTPDLDLLDALVASIRVETP